MARSHAQSTGSSPQGTTAVEGDAEVSASPSAEGVGVQFVHPFRRAGWDVLWSGSDQVGCEEGLSPGTDRSRIPCGATERLGSDGGCSARGGTEQGMNGACLNGRCEAERLTRNFKDRLLDTEPSWEVVTEASEEVLLLWSLRDPFHVSPSQMSRQAKQEVLVDVAGQRMVIQQDPCCLRLPGVTGSVLWDSGIVLARLLDICCSQGWLSLRAWDQADSSPDIFPPPSSPPSLTAHSSSASVSSTASVPSGSRSGLRCCELGAGCGLLGLTALALGACHVTLTDQHDRLRLLASNVDRNMASHCLWMPDIQGGMHCPPAQHNEHQHHERDKSLNTGSGHRAKHCNPKRSSKAKGPGPGANGKWPRSTVVVEELTWGEPLEGGVASLGGPFGLVLGSDLVYSEEQVLPLLSTLKELCGPHTLVLLSGELRNDAVLELFLEEALKDFFICRAPHPFPWTTMTAPHECSPLALGESSCFGVTDAHRATIQLSTSTHEKERQNGDPGILVRGSGPDVIFAPRVVVYCLRLRSQNVTRVQV